MKRDRFTREVLDRFSGFEEWARRALGERRGETPYELLCEWRGVYGVDAPINARCAGVDGPPRTPYPSVRIEEVPSVDGRAAFMLVCPSNREAVAGSAVAGFADTILAWARTEPASGPRVTFYHPTLDPIEYEGWREPAKWKARAPRSFSELPTDLWLYFAKLLRKHNQHALLGDVLIATHYWSGWKTPRFDCIWLDMLQHTYSGGSSNPCFHKVLRLSWDCKRIMRAPVHLTNLESLTRRLQNVIFIKITGRRIRNDTPNKRELVGESETWSVRGYPQCEPVIRTAASTGAVQNISVTVHGICAFNMRSASDLFNFLTGPICLPLRKRE